MRCVDPPESSLVRRLCSAAIILLPLSTAMAADAFADLRARAATAYDAGDCATALPLMRELDAAGAADGPWLYRLYYCLRETGDPAAREAIGRARDTLIAEFEKKPGLENGFYLANAYRNAARLSSAAEVAEQVTSEIESGAIPGPTTPMQTFQLGKLYADQGSDARAVALYTESLEGLIVPGQPMSPTAQWAARYLAERAWDAQDWAGAARFYGMLDRKGAAPQDFDRLAMALVQGGAYREAARAWFEALRLNPAGGDRARYCAQLASQAADVAPLPETAPDGRAWEELAGEDLGQILFDNAQLAKTTLQEVGPDAEGLSKERRNELNAKLQAARALFMRAGLEAALRQIPLRETAFQSGYAQLIFHKTSWELPAPKSKRWLPPKPDVEKKTEPESPPESESESESD